MFGAGVTTKRGGREEQVGGLEVRQMVAGNGDVFHLAQNGRVGDRHAEPISEPSPWQGQPPSAEVGSLSAEENRDMITANRIQDPLDRLATVAERYMNYLEREARASEAEKEHHDERMLTPLEASKILRVHVQTVMTWCREGKLDAVKIGGNKVNGKGGKFLIPREAIDAYIAQQRLIHGSRKGCAK